MAKKLYEESSIQAIADAIREKNGETTTYKPSEMAAAITAITTGGGGVEVEPIVLSGNCSYVCSGVLASNYIKLFGDTITTNNISSVDYMFKHSSVEYIPFELNFDNSSNSNMYNMFYECVNLKTLPKANNARPYSMNSMFFNCNRLREIPSDWCDSWDFSAMSQMTSAYQGNCSSIVEACYSLRSIPLSMFSGMNPNAYYMYSYFYSGFENCYVIDELVDLPIPYKTAWTNNTFSRTVNDCRRLKRLTFATNEDGTPIVVQWKAQTIDLTRNVGFYEVAISSDPEHWDTVDLGNSINYSGVTNYNSGITADKAIYNTATYEALKDDPDAFFLSSPYYKDRYYFSRYNHDSAVETINSLPDTSAYLATAGGTNTIKFKDKAGLGTDGGAINTLTEEEIAVAAAKGWTVSLA